MNHDMIGRRRADFFDFAAQILSRGNGLRVRARGWSMYPFIRHGDVIEVEPVEASAVRVGDVIFCRDEVDRFVTHRVVKRGKAHSQGALVTKGDWTSRADPLVHPEQVLGRVVAIERGAKRIRLNTRMQRLTQVLWARISPYSRWLYLPVRTYMRAAYREMDSGCSPPS